MRKLVVILFICFTSTAIADENLVFETADSNWILIGADIKHKERSAGYVDKFSIKNEDAETRYAASKLVLSYPDATIYMKNLYKCNDRESLSLGSYMHFHNQNQKHLSSEMPSKDRTWVYVPKGDKLAQKIFDYVCK